MDASQTSTGTITQTNTQSKNSTNAKIAGPPKMKRPCLLYFFMIVFRFICLVAGVAELAYGAWNLYMVKNDKSTLPGLEHVAEGLFLCLAGLAIIFAELRTRWTTTSAIKVIFFLGSWLGRGIFYICIALLNLPITTEVWTFTWLDGRIFAGLIGLAGILSLIMHPFFFRLERRREMARQTWIAEQLVAGVELEGIVINPREFNTGTTMYDPTLAKLAPEA